MKYQILRSCCSFLCLLCNKHHLKHYKSVNSHRYMYVHVYGGQRTGIFHLSLLPSFLFLSSFLPCLLSFSLLLRQGLSQGYVKEAVLPASPRDPPASPVLRLQTHITALGFLCGCFKWVVRTPFASLYLQYKHFTVWAVSPALAHSPCDSKAWV